ncbi:MAG: hypothetical protein KGJ13_01490, partial [Patescibacteria group bacterium]|nr:hypothetical protein [Patescibacteria group bacterium]
MKSQGKTICHPALPTGRQARLQGNSARKSDKKRQKRQQVFCGYIVAPSSDGAKSLSAVCRPYRNGRT